jgi:hypothetical protein
VVAEADPVCWPLLVELQEARMQTGAFAFTGADTAAAGSTVAEPIWTVPIDSWADWLPDWLCPARLVVAEVEPACWPPLLEEQVAATQTGASTFTGADPAAAGSTVTEPTWTVPIDSPADRSAGWLESEPEPPFVPPEAPPFSWGPAWLLQIPARHTSASTFAGAFADAAGETFPKPSWTVRTEWSADCP